MTSEMVCLSGQCLSVTLIQREAAEPGVELEELDL